MILDWLESPLATNALLLALLLWMVFHGRIQRFSHRLKRAIKKLVGGGLVACLWRVRNGSN